MYWVKLLGAQHVGIGLDYFFEDDDGDDHFSEVLAANADYWPDQYPGEEVACARPAQLGAGTELRTRGLNKDDVDADGRQLNTNCDADLGLNQISDGRATTQRSVVVRMPRFQFVLRAVRLPDETTPYPLEHHPSLKTEYSCR